jgi:hypothetical protein
LNKYQPHVFVLPEDDANRQLANAFHEQVDLIRSHQMRVLRVAGGWTKVLNLFTSEHVLDMDRCATRFIVLLIDLDGDENRLRNAKAAIPVRLADRVFVLGALTKPEALRADLGSYKAIGSAMARDCVENTNAAWGHRLLQHNAGELNRLRQHVLPILFPPI